MDDKDRKRFLVRLSERVEQYNIRLYMYVLMSNHFHLVFETPEGNCSKFMQSLSTAYTVYYNFRHKRHGHLFDGRYKAKLVDSDDYLLTLSRYVHLNPVKVSGRKKLSLKDKTCLLREYTWSSYQGYISSKKKQEFVEYTPVLAEIKSKKSHSAKRYREFVESGIAETDDEFIEILNESPRCIGGDQFREWVDQLYLKLLETHAVPEDVSFRHITEPLEPKAVLLLLSDLLEVDVKEFKTRRRDSDLRGIAARCLSRYAGLTQREIAKELNMGSGVAASQQLKRLAERVQIDKKLSKTVKIAEGKLSDLKEYV